MSEKSDRNNTMPALRFSRVFKYYGATKALDGVDLDLMPGEIHALIGENGAGKSTLMKIASGACQPDSGQVEFSGKHFRPESPSVARHLGVRMIYQELNLAPQLPVEENLLLGCEPARWGWINLRKRRRLAEEALERLNHESDISLDTPVYQLSVAHQQVIEIARACMGSPEILLMDEPTSSLSRQDVENLFEIMRKLKADGVSILYISHFLEECREIADRFSVLRDGKVIGSGSMQDAGLRDIVRMMVGWEIKDFFPRSSPRLGKPVFEVTDLSRFPKPIEATFKVHRGEIFGIAGLIGAGRTEMLRTCFGLDSGGSGSIRVDGNPVHHRNPYTMISHGVGYLSENRKEEGLMLYRDLAENITLSNLQSFSRLGFLDNKGQYSEAVGWMKYLDVKGEGPDQRVFELSGGNQQKVAFGRLLHQDAFIWLLDEPTRGIDIYSKTQIYKYLKKLAESGKAIVFVSSSLPELLGICHTIGVMSRGRLVEIRSTEKWSEQELLKAALGFDDNDNAQD